MLWGNPMFTHPFWMSMPLCSGHLVVTVWLLSSLVFCGCHQFSCYEGNKDTPLWGQGSLFMWVWVLCVKEVDISPFFLLTWRGTYLLQPPSFVLPTMTQFHEWSHWSRGSLSNDIYGQQCHSLSQMHMFPLMSTPMSCYLWSTPVFCGCSGGHPW